MQFINDWRFDNSLRAPNSYLFVRCAGATCELICPGKITHPISGFTLWACVQAMNVRTHAGRQSKVDNAFEGGHIS